MENPVVPTPTVVNIFEDGKSIDIATPFELARIQAQYIPLFYGKQHTSTVLPGANQICYIITGEGTLTKDGKSAPLRVDDCFSFAAVKDVERSYTVDAKESDMGLLVISDTPHTVPAVLVRLPLREMLLTECLTNPHRPKRHKSFRRLLMRTRSRPGAAIRGSIRQRPPI